MTETHHTFCRICEASCGLEIDVENDRITAIRPDEQHVSTEGFACVKGLKQYKLYDSPDRLQYPLVRGEDGELHRATWDEALAKIGSSVKRIKKQHGKDAIAMYVGTAAGFSILHPIFAQGFMTGVGSKSMFSSSTQDCSNKFAVAREVYGFPFTQPFPDLEKTECLIVVGANPVVSKWAFLQVSNPSKRLKEIEERGGHVFHVDPRRTESAKAAGEHVFIKPGTDVFFYMSFLCELIARGGVDEARVRDHTTGYAELASLVDGWTAERTAGVTGIEPETLRRMVDTYARADGASLYCSTGVNMGGQGALSFWLQETINTISGNLDKPGGTLVGQGIFDFAKFGKKNGTLMSDARSRIGGFGAVNDGLPGGILADEILTPGEGQIRALFVTGGNPLLTMAGATKLRDAFEDLELLVVLDILGNETAAKADVVLPCTSPLQRPDLPFVFPLWLGMQMRPYLQATTAVVPPTGEQRDEPTIYTQIARASGAPLFGSRALQWIMQLSMWWHSWGRPQPRLPLEGILGWMLRLTRQVSFKTLLGHKHGLKRPPNAGGDFLPDRIVTDDKKVHLAPPRLMAAAANLGDLLKEEERAAKRLRLITKRAVTTHNSWTHNLEDWVTGERGSNYLYMHPEDLAQLGLSDGDLADVSTDAGAVRVPVRRLADLMPGTVALPHGWGHQQAEGLSVASQTRGVNANILAPSGPGHIDPLSGMSRLTGLAVEVVKAEGEQDNRDWSGLPA